MHLLTTALRLYDTLEKRWEHPSTQRILAYSLSGLFIILLLLIECARQGWIPFPTTRHFDAIALVFSLMLLLELAELIFGMVGSFTYSMGKQLEIFSLILLRAAFKAFAKFDEPIVWEHITEPLKYMLVDAAGAFVVFVLLAIYYRLHKQHPITGDPSARASFIAAKKILALGLLIGFFIIGLLFAYRYVTGQPTFPFFETFFILLIFSDIFIVLFSLRYSTEYAVVFRNFGFALATVILRLGFIAPEYYRVAMSLIATILSIGLVWGYNLYWQQKEQKLTSATPPQAQERE